MNDLRNELSDYQKLMNEHRALAFLRVLQREPAYCMNECVMLDWLRTIALVSTRENLMGCATVLEKQGLITIELVNNLKVFNLTQKGDEVALGYTVIDGVARPQPNCPY